MAAVQAHRGRWVLPFGMGADRDKLLPRLPAHTGPVPALLEAW